MIICVHITNYFNEKGYQWIIIIILPWAFTRKKTGILNHKKRMNGWIVLNRVDYILLWGIKKKGICAIILQKYGSQWIVLLSKVVYTHYLDF